MNKGRNELVAKRKELGMTQEKLAETLGISQAHVSDIEKGKKKPSLQIAVKMSIVLRDPQLFYHFNIA